MLRGTPAVRKCLQRGLVLLHHRLGLPGGSQEAGTVHTVSVPACCRCGPSTWPVTSPGWPPLFFLLLLLLRGKLWPGHPPGPTGSWRALLTRAHLALFPRQPALPGPHPAREPDARSRGKPGRFLGTQDPTGPQGQRVTTRASTGLLLPALRPHPGFGSHPGLG